MSNQSKTPVSNILKTLSTFAEMSHIFYTAMIVAGADKAEAIAGMQGFINVYWDNGMKNARRKKQEDEQSQ